MLELPQGRRLCVRLTVRCFRCGKSAWPRHDRLSSLRRDGGCHDRPPCRGLGRWTVEGWFVCTIRAHGEVERGPAHRGRVGNRCSGRGALQVLMVALRPSRKVSHRAVLGTPSTCRSGRRCSPLGCGVVTRRQIPDLPAQGGLRRDLPVTRPGTQIPVSCSA